MNKLIFITLVFSILLGLNGCKKSTVTDVATADVFVQSTINPNDTTQTVYAVVSSIFSYNPMSSVTVVAPDNSTMQLTNYANLGNSFYNDPVYSANPFQQGVYNYTVKFQDGQTAAYTNTLLPTTIAPPTIKSVSKTLAGDSINLRWNAVPNAEAYQMKITKGSGSSLIVVYYTVPFVDSSNPPRSAGHRFVVWSRNLHL